MRRPVDPRDELKGQTERSGIARVDVVKGRRLKDVAVHFVVSPLELTRPLTDLDADQVRVMAPSAIHVEANQVKKISWARDVLHVTLDRPLDSGVYTLAIDDDRLHADLRDASLAPDRRELLRYQNKVTGIDFVLVGKGQKELEVHYLPNAPNLEAPLNDLRQEQIRIEGEPRVALEPPAPGESVLKVQVKSPGGFDLYRFWIDDPRIDPYFNGVPFTFKAECPSEFDCLDRERVCPSEDDVAPVIDYRARDYRSLRRALLDFASLRYPDWEDRGREADAGVMLTEVMAALGDELAYSQDRIAREATLETATQRRSLRRHARLVDYEIQDGFGASTWLDVRVAENANGEVSIPAGTAVVGEGRDGKKIVFEVGRGLWDTLTEDPNDPRYRVTSNRNSLRPHIWDRTDPKSLCLPAGSTELLVEGSHDDHLPLEEWQPDRVPGRWILLQTKSQNPSVPERAWMAWLTDVGEYGPDGRRLRDPLRDDLPLTRLKWDEAHATPFDLDLQILDIHANIVPATAGRTFVGEFHIDPQGSGDLLGVVERIGPDGTPAYLLSLARIGKPLGGSIEDADCAVPFRRGRGSLVWRAIGSEFTAARDGDSVGGSKLEDWQRYLIAECDDRNELRAEVWLEEISSGWRWTFKRSLLGADGQRASRANDTHFTLDDGTWETVVAYRRDGERLEYSDYKSGAGHTVRFGDGVFGKTPAKGTGFKVHYRLGNGQAGNVAPGVLTRFEPELPFVESVTNPLPATDGLEPEVAEEIRKIAPEAYRAKVLRAVTPGDYATKAKEELEWVQRAGARLRWTGSWPSLFVTADPKGATSLSASRRRELAQLLDRYRQAGRDLRVVEPCYADLEIEITVCLEPSAYRGEVKRRVQDALTGVNGSHSNKAFFHPDHFTFGMPLERSRLEAAVHSVGGVRAVETVLLGRRGRFDPRPFTEPAFWVADNEIIRLENDPDHPERGSLNLQMKGGA